MSVEMISDSVGLATNHHRSSNTRPSSFRGESQLRSFWPLGNSSSIRLIAKDRSESVMGPRQVDGRVWVTSMEDLLTQEEMVISVRGHNILDRSEFLDRDLGLVVERGRGGNPDVTRGELDRGRATTHREPSEEPGERSREGNELGGDLRHSGVRLVGTDPLTSPWGINTSRMTVSAICVGRGEGIGEVVGVRGKGGLVVSARRLHGGKNI